MVPIYNREQSISDSLEARTLALKHLVAHVHFVSTTSLLSALMPQPELDSLQATLNAAIDTIRHELSSGGYPDLSSLAIEPHPLDNASHMPSRKLFEAQTTAIGKAPIPLIIVVLLPPSHL